MTGYYVYCRAWTNFSEKFPWFDELNPFPDDQLCSELNIRALNWLRENRPAAKQRYREERRKLKNIACEPQTLCPGSVVRGMPNMPFSRELEIRDYLAILDRQALLDEATLYGIQLALPVSELIKAIVSAKKTEFSERECERQRLKDRRSAEQIPDLPDVRKEVRGDRKKSCLETRIARVAGWLTQDTLSFGRLSPTPKLLLKRVATENELRELLAVARARFEEPNWNLPMLRFGSLSCGELSAPELVLLKRKSDNLLRPDYRWTGTPLFQAILYEFCKVAQDLADTKTVCQTNLPGTGSETGIGGDPAAAHKAELIAIRDSQLASYDAPNEVEGSLADTQAPARHSSGKDASELPWDHTDERFLTGNEAVELSKGKLKLSSLSKLCRAGGPIRYMRKRGVGLRVSLADLRQHLRTRHPEDAFDTMDEYIKGIEGRKGEACRAKQVGN